MKDHYKKTRGPQRIPPDDAVPDIVERVVPRRNLRVERGDVVITRERVPGLNPFPIAPPPWRFRVGIAGQPVGTGATYNSFQHAASDAEQRAAANRLRVIYVEDESSSLLADYRG